MSKDAKMDEYFHTPVILSPTVKLVKDLKTKKEQTEYLLAKFPGARDNDFYLQYMWLKMFGGIRQPLPFLDWEDITKIGGQLESIRRVRQKIQNVDLKYLPSEKVLEKRRARCGHFKEAIKEI
jgi:hypothetical protein